VRRAFTRASGLGGWQKGHWPLDGECEDLHARAAAAFAKAEALLPLSQGLAVGQDGGEGTGTGAGLAETAAPRGDGDVAATVLDNRAKFEVWKMHGGTFQGALMW
jgi:hypothetical protein